MLLEDIELRDVGAGRVLANFRVHMRGVRSGAETSMRLWNLVTLDGGRIASIRGVQRRGRRAGRFEALNFAVRCVS